MSKLSIGIVGLPNVGKSTLFNLLTKKEVDAANYPFCTIDPNVGIVSVPDERLDWLSNMSKSEEKIPAIVEFYDIAGLVKGANQGAGLGNKFLSHIREVDAILMVLRGFKDTNVIHVEGEPDPLRDLEIINSELILKDLDTLEKRLLGLEKQVRARDKESLVEKQLLETAKERLGKGELIVDMADELAIKNLGLLASKKQLYFLNGNDFNVIDKISGEVVVADLSDDDSFIGDLVKKAYKTLDLVSFFTTGPKETRAWTIKRGSLAPEAAGVIHSDFENKFIRAEAVGYEDLNQSGSWLDAKKKGLIRLEGKQYEIKDGDSVIFHHS